MMRTLFISAAIAFAATSASAQDPLTRAKNAANKAVAATNAHIEAEQRPDGKQKAPVTAARGAAVTTQTLSPKVQEPAAGAHAGGVQPAGTKLAVPTADTANVPPPSILREAYGYASDGRRDPFFSLLATPELRPALSDLRVVGILIDNTGGHSVATLRENGTNLQYRVTTGATLGRMRVTAIRLLSVVFTIDEFGTTRQDSLVLRDTTKVRR